MTDAPNYYYLLDEGFEGYIITEKYKAILKINDLIHGHKYTSELDGLQKLSAILIPFSKLNKNYSKLSLNNDFAKAMLNVPWFRALVNFQGFIDKTIYELGGMPHSYNSFPFRVIKNKLSSKDCYKFIVGLNLKQRSKYASFLEKISFDINEISEMLVEYDEQTDILLNSVATITQAMKEP